jgi:hypothetical protein
MLERWVKDTDPCGIEKAAGGNANIYTWVLGAFCLDIALDSHSTTLFTGIT